MNPFKLFWKISRPENMPFFELFAPVLVMLFLFLTIPFTDYSEYTGKAEDYKVILVEEKKETVQAVIEYDSGKKARVYKKKKLFEVTRNPWFYEDGEIFAGYDLLERRVILWKESHESNNN